MKKSKKLFALVPLFGLFLTGCSLDDTWLGKHIINPIKDSFAKKEQASEKDEKTTPSEGGTPSGGQDTAKVNPLWPASEISAFLTQYEITETLPGYTGEAKSIELVTQTYVYVVIEVADSSTETLTLNQYFTDVTNANWTKGGKTEDDDQIYLSPGKQLALIAYGGSDVNDAGYVYISFGRPSDDSGGEEDSDVVAAINSALESELGANFLTYDSENYSYSGYKVIDQGKSTYVDEAAESVLKPALDEKITLLPSSLGTPKYTFYTAEDDYFQDGDPCNVAEYKYTVGDEEVMVYTYCYNSKLIFQITVW